MHADVHGAVVFREDVDGCAVDDLRTDAHGARTVVLDVDDHDAPVGSGKGILGLLPISRTCCSDVFGHQSPERPPGRDGHLPPPNMTRVHSPTWQKMSQLVVTPSFAGTLDAATCLDTPPIE